MENLNYCVVFAYNDKAGGYAGIRFYTAYKNKDDFKKNSRSNENVDIVAQGVTDEEAQKLTALTPEICRVTAAIDESCAKEDGIINIQILEYNIGKSVYGIKHDRQVRKMNSLAPLNDDFAFVDVASLPDSPKKQLLNFVEEEFYSPSGDFLNLEINIEEIKIRAVIINLHE